MQSQKLESIKAQNPRLKRRLDELADYIAAEVAEGRNRIVPALAATAMKSSEAEALGLLSLLEDAGLIQSVYEIVCKEKDVVLASVHSREELPALLTSIHCDFCGEEHKSTDVTVEIVFEVTSQAARNAFA